MTEHKQQSSWQRVIFVAIFWVIFYFAQFIAGLIALAQCLFYLLTGNANDYLMRFGESLGKYIHEILRYITFNSDKQPFPFNDFPKADLIIPAESK